MDLSGGVNYTQPNYSKAGIGLGIASTVGNIVGMALQHKQSKDNLKLQKDQYEYQKWLNQTTMDREDNAVQRRVVDLERAGLNPVLAAGSQAQASHQTSAPAPQKEMDFMAMKGMLLNMGQQLADISRTKAEKDRIATETSLAKKYYELEERRTRADETRTDSDRRRTDSQIVMNRITNILHDAQTNNINQHTANEKLRNIGIGYENIQKLLRIRAETWDIMYAINTGGRTYESLSPPERLAVKHALVGSVPWLNMNATDRQFEKALDDFFDRLDGEGNL